MRIFHKSYCNPDRTVSQHRNNKSKRHSHLYRTQTHLSIDQCHNYINSTYIEDVEATKPESFLINKYDYYIR